MCSNRMAVVLVGSSTESGGYPSLHLNCVSFVHTNDQRLGKKKLRFPSYERAVVGIVACGGACCCCCCCCWNLRLLLRVLLLLPMYTDSSSSTRSFPRATTLRLSRFQRDTTTPPIRVWVCIFFLSLLLDTTISCCCWLQLVLLVCCSFQS